MQQLPRWSFIYGSAVSQYRYWYGPGETRCGPVYSHKEAGGHWRIQDADIERHCEVSALLSRWQREDARRGGRHHAGWRKTESVSGQKEPRSTQNSSGAA